MCFDIMAKHSYFTVSILITKYSTPVILYCLRLVLSGKCTYFVQARVNLFESILHVMSEYMSDVIWNVMYDDLADVILEVRSDDIEELQSFVMSDVMVDVMSDVMMDVMAYVMSDVKTNVILVGVSIKILLYDISFL